MEAKKVTFTAKPGTFRDAVRAYKKYKEDKELYTPEEAYELTMKDVKAIYAKEYAV